MFFPLYDNNPHVRTPWFTIAIILANVVIHFQVARTPLQRQNEIYCHFGFIPARVEQLNNPNLVLQVKQPIGLPAQPGAEPPMQVIKLQPNQGEIYFSMLSMMFLHGSWLHLIGNMWFLWIFGNNIEDRLGHFLFVLYYLVGGGIALACQYYINPGELTPTIGASGAISAVLGGYAITFPTAKVRCLIFLVVFFTMIDLPAVLVLGFFFVLDILQALNPQPAIGEERVAFWAHIGGFVAGMLLMPLMSMGASPPGTSWRDEAAEQFRFEDSQTRYRDPEPPYSPRNDDPFR